MIVGALLAVGISAANEPMRRYLETTLNDKVDGYTIYIPGFHFSPLGLAFTFEDLTVDQDAHPDPPVMYYPKIRFSVQWGALLHAKLVADVVLDKPLLYVDRSHLEQEGRDKVALQDKGWQDAVEAMYPLRIDAFRIVNGDVTYVDDDPQHPLRLTGLNATVQNIRNIRAKGQPYPSTFKLTSDAFETGKLAVDGRADFLAKPNPTFRTAVKLDGAPLDRMKPVLARANVRTNGGVMSLDGEVESTAKEQHAHMKNVTIRDFRVDYIRPRNSAESERAAEIKRVAVDAAERPASDLRVDELKLVNSTLGYINEVGDPGYRAFLSDATISVHDVSNRPNAAPMRTAISGKFMGNGVARIDATVRPGQEQANFDFAMRVETTDMQTMNDILRTHGNFDVRHGEFSLYSEVAVRNGEVKGYVKPIFKDLDVYDRQQDGAKSPFHQLYEGLAGGFATLFQNSKDEVATKADISGRLENPKLSTWEILVNLVENAFFRAIVPGFENELKAKKG